MANFTELKEKVTIIQALEMLDAMKVMKEEGKGFRGPCPICKEGGARAFQVYPATNSYYCWSERKGGTIIDLVMRQGRTDQASAGRKLAEYFQLSTPRTQQEPKPNKFDPLAYLGTLDAEHEALKDIGVLPETLVAFQAGYCSKGLNRGRLAVAWHNVEGELRAFIGVALQGELPQYLLPKAMPTPYFFGTHRIEEGAEVHIVPSVLDVMSAWENGAANTLAPLRPIDGDSLTCLLSLVRAKSLTIDL